MATTFLFYDIETSGLNPTFDQVLQFAAIRTDMDFQPIETHAFYVNPTIDVVPDPHALQVHGIGIEQCLAGCTEYEAMAQIHALFNTPDTLSLGYNTLGFDDGFLRFGFHRHLRSPYTHQYAQGCGRADLYPMMPLYRLYRPDLCRWPTPKDGRLSLKLEDLAHANDIEVGEAHDALNDVRATLALAQQLAHDRDMWQYALGYFDKATMQRRFVQWGSDVAIGTQTFKTALYVDGALGHGQAFQAPVLILGPHHVYRNQWICLRLDVGDLSATDFDTVATVPTIIRKKITEGGILLPMKSRFLGHLSATRQAMVQTQLSWCQANPDVIAAICEHHLATTYADIEGCDVDGALYQSGFKSKTAQQQCAHFIQASWAEKSQLLANWDGDDAVQALRILGRFGFEHLDAHAQSIFLHHCRRAYGMTEQPRLDHRGQPQRDLAEVLNILDGVLADDAHAASTLQGWHRHLTDLQRGVAHLEA